MVRRRMRERDGDCDCGATTSDLRVVVAAIAKIQAGADGGEEEARNGGMWFPRSARP